MNWQEQLLGSYKIMFQRNHWKNGIAVTSNIQNVWTKSFTQKNHFNNPNKI